MKKIVLSFMFVLLSILICAQNHTDLTLGVTAGYNLTQHYGTKDQTGDYIVRTGFRHGFTTGLNLHLPINDKFALMYEFLYVTRGSKENITIVELDDEPLVKPAVMDVKYFMDYVEFPFLLQYKFMEKKNFSLSMVSGVAMALKVKGDYELDGVIYFPDGDGYSTFILKDKSHLEEVNMFDFSLIYGGELGFQFWSTPMALAYRFTIGWDYLDLPTYSAGDSAPVSLRNQSYSLSLRIPFQIKI